MIKIIALSFEEAARLERILNRNEIPYKWDFSSDYLGCIDKLYDIELEDKYVTATFTVGIVRLTLWRDVEVGGINISRADFKEVIIS